MGGSRQDWRLVWPSKIEPIYEWNVKRNLDFLYKNDLQIDHDYGVFEPIWIQGLILVLV